jgi:hypothetical protein
VLGLVFRLHPALALYLVWANGLSKHCEIASRTSDQVLDESTFLNGLAGNASMPVVAVGLPLGCAAISPAS